MQRNSFVAIACLVVMGASSALAVLIVDSNSSCALAQGNACASTCRSAYNDCRIATKGSSSCDAQYQACLQSCVKR